MPSAIPPVTVGRGRARVVVGGRLPVMILGPCVIESRAHALAMARRVLAAARRAGLPAVFKASFDKANRTSGASFRGQSIDDGLAILSEVRERTGLPVTTDVHEAWQVERAAQHVDLLQVPALLCRQSDLILACAASGVPTSVKKGQFLAPWDCRNLVAKFQAAPAPRGAARQRLILIERGTSFGYNTLINDFRALPQMRQLGVPVIFDATHSVQAPGGQGDRSGGASHYAPMLARAALACGVEGVFMETHDQPAKALSDGPNSIPSRHLPGVLRELRGLHDHLGRPDPPQPFAT